MKLRVLIADDEPLGRERLRRFLQAEPRTEIVAECANGKEAVHAIRKTAPNLVLLDVKMPELDGFGVLQALDGVQAPAVIFVTGYAEFAVRAFEAHAVDYLLKPFDRERFQAALQRARERLQRQRSSSPEPSPLGLLATLTARRNALQRVTIKSGGRIVVVKTSEIDWISAADNYVELHVGSTVHLLRMTITAMADRLPPGQFVRISRSLLVNVHRIKEIRSKTHGDCLIILEHGTRLTATRNYRRNWAELLSNAPWTP